MKDFTSNWNVEKTIITATFLLDRKDIEFLMTYKDEEIYLNGMVCKIVRPIGYIPVFPVQDKNMITLKLELLKQS
jgi:hypothetical protein